MNEPQAHVVAPNELLADLMVVEEIARVAPELNPSNYDHDDVCRLNSAMCDLYEVVRKYRHAANPSLQGTPGTAYPAKRCSNSEVPK